MLHPLTPCSPLLPLPCCPPCIQLVYRLRADAEIAPISKREDHGPAIRMMEATLKLEVEALPNKWMDIKCLTVVGYNDDEGGLINGRAHHRLSD